MTRSWSDEPVNLTIEIRKVSLGDLPTLLGKKIDKEISEILIAKEQEPFYWTYNDKIIKSIDLTKFLNNVAPEGSVSAEVEIKALSSGYYDPGKAYGRPDDCYPPEGDDEREVQTVKIIFYDEDGETKLSSEFQNICQTLFGQEFDEEIYDVEISPEDDGGYADYLYEQYKDRG